MSTSFQTLRDLVIALGVATGDVDRAEADGTLGLMAIDRMILADQDPKYTQTEVVERTGLGTEAVRFWRALGFPDPGPDDRIFSDFDIEMLQLVDQLVKLGLIAGDEALQMTRVIGSSMARIASAQIDAIENRIDEPTFQDGTEPAVLRARFLIPAMPRILEYTWKRHLQSAARRRMVREMGASEGSYNQSVGFADLVGFTALSQQLTDHELAVIVDRFEATAYDIVGALGGRVIKMIGDEVMFSVDDVGGSLEIGLSLAEAYHDDQSLSDVRVGIACGPVLEREGDLFGPVVNLASRIVSIAYAGSVVVASDIHDALADDERLRWKSLRTRQLKDIGRVQLWAARRASDDFER
ncbi:MAG TPA: adenylate/guanylate cyclase domain-containing protein, partial [Acidimicrobiales bacterium]|nr:adenylate/guanylate cyclase domain-containing protein [Acidimicrobiales bacterium]